jgi:hypothetical protein
MRAVYRGRTLVLGALVLALGLAACTPPEPPPEPTAGEAATGTEAAGSEPVAREKVTFVATDFKYDGPASFPAGLTEVELVNEGESHHGLVVVGLGQDKTTDDVLEILEVEGPIPSWVVFAGGLNGLAPGERASYVYDFEPGRYAVFSFESAEGSEVMDAAQGMIQELEITEDDGSITNVPEADLTLDLTDFAFTSSEPMTAGPHVIQINNEGEQAHEALVMKLVEGMTADQVVEMMTAMGPEEGAAAGGTPPGDASAGATPSGEAAASGTPGAEEGAPPEGAPFTSAGGLAPIPAGASAVLSMSFEPGDYMLICFLPDPADGTPHLAKGMVQAFTIE